MALPDELRDHLFAVDRGTFVLAASVPSIDLSPLRQHFLAQREAQELIHPQKNWFLAETAYLLKPAAFQSFVASAVRELSVGLCHAQPADEVARHLQLVIDLALGLHPENLSDTRSRELRRIVSTARSECTDNRRSLPVAEYAFEAHLVRRSQNTPLLTRLGRLILDVTTVDAVRTLLHLEVRLSSAIDDVRFVHCEALAFLLDHSPITLSMREGVSDDGMLFQPAQEPGPTLQHLADLLVIQLEPPTEERGWRSTLDERFREVLQDVVQSRPTPLSLLIDSLLSDERSSLSGHIPTVRLEESQALLQARHAQMVVHEIRNAIGPVQQALQGIYRAMERHPSDASWQAQRERVDKGIGRLFGFANELEQVVRLGSTPAAPFDLVASLHDAIQALNGGLGLVLSLEASGDLPMLIGHRPQMTIVFVNLLRNAAQNSANPNAKMSVRVVYDRPSERLSVTLDDDGPGVPAEHRERIFEPGFSLRSGGSGRGLSIVREVVEEMHGVARCEASDLGGARFVLIFPVAPQESP